MLEETLDPRPQPELFARLLVERATARGQDPADLRKGDDAGRYEQGFHERVPGRANGRTESRVR